MKRNIVDNRPFMDRKFPHPCIKLGCIALNVPIYETINLIEDASDEEIEELIREKTILYQDKVKIHINWNKSTDYGDD